MRLELPNALTAPAYANGFIGMLLTGVWHCMGLPDCAACHAEPRVERVQGHICANGPRPESTESTLLLRHVRYITAACR